MADLSALLGPYYRSPSAARLSHLLPYSYVLERDREEAGLEAPPISPDDFLGSGALKAAGAGAVSLASLLGLAKMAGKGGPKMYPKQAGVISGKDILSKVPSLKGTAVVDETGSPLLTYHASSSSEPISEFNRRFKPDVRRGKDSIDSIGTWFTDNVARTSDYGTSVYPSYLGLKNPLVLDSFDDLRALWREAQTEGRRNKEFFAAKKLYSQNPHWGNSNRLVDELKFDGYDGVVIRKHGSGEWKDQNAYIVFDPQNITSAISP